MRRNRKLYKQTVYEECKSLRFLLQLVVEQISYPGLLSCPKGNNSEVISLLLETVLSLIWRKVLAGYAPFVSSFAH